MLGTFAVLGTRALAGQQRADPVSNLRSPALSKCGSAADAESRHFDQAGLNLLYGHASYAKNQIRSSVSIHEVPADGERHPPGEHAQQDMPPVCMLFSFVGVRKTCSLGTLRTHQLKCCNTALDNCLPVV